MSLATGTRRTMDDLGTWGFSTAQPAAISAAPRAAAARGMSRGCHHAPLVIADAAAQIPAACLRAGTLSVLSQVKSSSPRPKCP